MAFSAKLIVVVVAALFSQGLCATHIRRSTDAANPLDEMIANARTSLEKIGEELTKITGSSPEEIRSAMEAKTQELQARAQSVIEEVKNQVETHGSELPERTRTAYTEIMAHLNQTVDNLKSQAPSTLEEMTAVQQRFADNFKSSMESFLVETKKLAKAAGDETGAVHDQVAEFTTTAVTKALELLRQMNTEVKAAVEKASSS